MLECSVALGGITSTIGNIHACARKAYLRTQELQASQQHASDVWRESGNPYIVVGDFNSTAEELTHLM